MMMHKCTRGMGSLLQVRKGTVLPRFGPKILQHLLKSHFFCNGSAFPSFLGSTKPESRIQQLKPPVTHRGFTGESLVPSFGDKSKKSRLKPAKRIKVAEQGKVLIRSNLGLEKSGWDDVQSSAYGASNDVVFTHLDEYFQNVDVQNLSSEAWEELKEDIEGFPFNGRTLNRTNVESCLLHYLRHTSHLQLAASFSAYLRENGGLQPFHYKQLLALYTDVTRLDGAEDEVKQLCQPIISEGPGSIFEDALYWLAVQAMAKTSAWREVLESALKHTKTSPETGPAGNNSCGEGSLGAFSTLIQQALEAGESSLAVRLVENPEFHRNLVPLRQNLQKRHQGYLDDVLLAWIKHCSGLAGQLERESALVKLVEYLGRRGLLVSEAVEEALVQFCDVSNLSARRASISQQGHCSCCGTCLPSHWQEGKEFNLLHKKVLDAVLQGKDIYQSTYPKELEEFLDMVDREGPFDVVIDGLNIAFSSTPGRYKDIQSRGQPGRLESLQVLNVVDYFCDAGLKVLVVSRRRAKFYKDYSKICNRARVHLLNKVTEDDPYIMLAALQSGPTCKIVTNDLLRQHFHLLWRLDPELGKAFTEWQVAHQVMVPAHRAYSRNMPPEKIYFTDPVIVNPPKHALTASHSSPFFHLPLAPNREEQVLTSLTLPSQWICLGPPLPPTSDLSESAVTNKKALKSKLLKHVESTLHNVGESKGDLKNVKNGNDKFDNVENEANLRKSRHRSGEDLGDNLLDQLKIRGRQLDQRKNMGKVNAIKDGEEWREAETSSDMQEQKRSYSRAGGRKEGRQSWPFEGGDWPEAPVQEDQKRSWSRAGGKKEGRQSWPFEGGDWPEAGTERRKWLNHSYGESHSGNDRKSFEAEQDAIGGKVEDAGAHWSQRKLPDPPKVQFEDQQKKQRYSGKRGGFQDKSRYRREEEPPSDF